MSLTSEQEWILVGCGLIAHADEILDIGEWDEVLRYVGSTLSEQDQLAWMEILSRQEQLERRFNDLAPLTDEAQQEDILRRCWQMALADGTGSDVVNFVPERIEVIADEMQVFGAAVLGLTIHCARCHSHKYDPIPQRDYYRLLDAF